MDKIPLINPELVKVISTSIDKTSTSIDNKPAPVLSAEVVSSTRVKEAPEQEQKSEYKVVLKIDQKLIETISPQDLKKGSQLEVKVLPGPELKIIANDQKAPVSTQSPNSSAAHSATSQLIQQLLADRIPQIKQQDLPSLIKQLAQLLQQPGATPNSLDKILSNTLKNPESLTPNTTHSTTTHSNPINPNTGVEGKQPTNRQSAANQAYQQIQPSLLSSNLPLSKPASSVEANIATSNTSTSNTGILHTGISNTETLQHLKNWLQQLPSSQDISTSTGLKNALNNTGIRAEAQLGQLAAQSLSVDSKSSNNIFKQLQSLHQQAFPTSTQVSENNKAPAANSKIDLATIVKKTAQTLADNTQQVFSGLIKKPFQPSVQQAATLTTTSTAQPAASSAPPSQVGLSWQNPLLNNPIHGSLESLLQDPLLQNPSSNNKFALSQILNYQALNNSLEQNDLSNRIPMNWPERSGNEAQLLRNLQNLLGHIEREQIQQRSSGDDSSLINIQQQQNSQWLPLLINHNHQFQLIEFYMEQEEKKNAQGEKKQHWFINLHFELPQLGQLGIEISMFENECNTTFWSESAATLNQLNQNIQPLRQRLTEQGIIVSDMQSRHGILAKSQNNIQQRLVDVKT